MKANLYVLFILLLSASGFGQPWAPVGAKWYYSYWPGLLPELAVVESTGDTLIHGQPCKILHSYMIYSVMLPNGSYTYDTLYCPPQYTYEDAGVVYLFDPDSGSFDVLYDFIAMPGSTITVKDETFEGFCPEAVTSSLFEYRVTAVSDTLITGKTLRKQKVLPTPNADWVFSDPSGLVDDHPIIETLGSLKFLFGVPLSQSMVGSIRCLRCYQDTGIFYRSSIWPDSLTCDYLSQLPTYIIEPEDNPFIVSPNPFRDYILIDRSNALSKIDIEIFSVEGRKIQTTTNQKLPLIIETNDFSRGFYLLKIRSTDRTSVFRLIKE
ncbi:MAG: T9SS type A sorting domain-containing protein [Bacteroidetes bacterium]|nr:T9SS type A sorting domain-containing protein [Bacteroidota bacterium]